MRVKVRVKPGAKQVKVEESGDTLIVWVRSPAREGKANGELIEVLAEYFSVPKSRVKIVRGHRGRDKLVEVEK